MFTFLLHSLRYRLLLSDASKCLATSLNRGRILGRMQCQQLPLSLVLDRPPLQVRPLPSIRRDTLVSCAIGEK